VPLAVEESRPYPRLVAGGRSSGSWPRQRVGVAVLFALAALPFHIAYGTATSAVVAVGIALVVALLLLWATRRLALWQYGAALTVGAVPLAYVTGTPPVVVALAVTAAGVMRRRGHVVGDTSAEG
jgi:hypothetical protein